MEEQQEARRSKQLSFGVHPTYAVPGDDDWLAGSLKLSGAFGLPHNLQPGDELAIQVANADGEVIASGVAEVSGVAFVPVRVKGEVIGTERAHKARLSSAT